MACARRSRRRHIPQHFFRGWFGCTLDGAGGPAYSFAQEPSENRPQGSDLMEPLASKDTGTSTRLDPRDRIRQVNEGIHRAARSRHLSPRTEQAYVGWVNRFIQFHRKRDPVAMGEPEI